MRVRSIAMSLVVLLVSGLPLFAQYEYQNVFNRRTANYERQFNPWNPVQTAYDQGREIERQQADRRLQEIADRYWQNQREMRERFERSQQEQRELANRMMYARMVHQARLNYGNAVIRAGAATSTFNINPKFSLKNDLLANAKTLELKQLLERHADPCLNQFRTDMRDRKLSDTDCADCGALAFWLCYRVFFEAEPSPTQLAWLRQTAKDSLLKDAYFQSLNDDERQHAAEYRGALAVYAKSRFDQRKESDPKIEAEAKYLAQHLLEQLWGNSINTLQMTETGFVHRGKQIIADGKATHHFKIDPELQTSRVSSNLSWQTQVKMTLDHKANVKQFYQLVEQKGGKRDDLAWCATIVAYQIYRVVSEGKDWNEQQFASTYEFTKKAIVNSPDIQAASDDNKQTASEQFAAAALSNYASYLRSDSRTVNIATARVQLLDLFRALNESPDDYDWTETGIVKVKRK